MRNLPAFGGSDFQGESRSTREIHVKVEKAAKIDEVVRVNCFDCVSQFILYALHV